MSRYDLVVLHTMVGSLGGTDSYFRDGNGAGFAGTESHFGTGHDGEIRQWQDTTRRADANGNGNHRIISVENADFGTGFPAWNTNDGAQVPAFTAAQIEANARICAWANQTHDIPLAMAVDSKPTTRGIGFHRLGVDPYRVSGGELWSTSYGKVCPGNRRIAQVPLIIARAKQIVNGEDDMPLTETDLDNIMRRVWRGAVFTDPASGKEMLFASAFVETTLKVRQVAVDAAVARRLAEEAAKGVKLSPEQIQQIAQAAAAEVAEDLSQGYDLTATPKPNA